MIKNKRILITGGAGSIGSELVRQLCKKNKIFILDFNETAFFDLYEELKQGGCDIYGRLGDIRDIDTLNEVVKDFKPDLIFNAVGLKHVTPSAWTPLEYVKTNIIGTLNVIKIAKNTGARLINISTDKVVQAESIMGSTKKVAEVAVKDAGFISVRFGNVLGSRGSIIPLWQQKIDKGESLNVTDSRMSRYVMSVQQACELLIQAAQIGKSGQILIMDMGEKVNILDLAKRIIKESGKDVGIKMIGMRPGETLTEELMTQDEAKRAIKIGKFWIIDPLTK